MPVWPPTPDIRDYPGFDCYSLGRIPSDYGVHIIIQNLGHDVESVRRKCAWALEEHKYFDMYPYTRQHALQALMDQYFVELVEYIRDDIRDTITKLFSWN